MSENKIGYTVDFAPSTIEAFRNRPFSNSFDSGFEQPTAQDVKALRSLCGWSQNDVAKLVGVNFNPSKGSTTVRKWETPENKPEHRKIPYSAWRLMLIYAGIVCVEVN